MDTLMLHRRLPVALLVSVTLLVVSALAATSASAAPGDRAIDDCTRDGKIDRSYSNKELRGALDDLPTDVDEYTDCREKLSDALRAQQSGSGSGSGSGGSNGTFGAFGGRGGVVGGTDTRSDDFGDSFAGAEALAPNEGEAGDLQRKIDGEGGLPLELGGEEVVPGDPSAGSAAAAATANALPLPLLIAMLAASVLIAVVAARRAGLPRRLQAAATGSPAWGVATRGTERVRDIIRRR
ncbi:MAG: hypothetical protein ACR2NA_02935 [Solirubrobacterales bacterium]